VNVPKRSARAVEAKDGLSLGELSVAVRTQVLLFALRVTCRAEDCPLKPPFAAWGAGRAHAGHGTRNEKSFRRNEVEEMAKESQSISLNDEQQLVVLELAGESYGVDIAAVNTIIRMQEITGIPRSPEFVEGVINLRGSIIPVIDLRKRFGLAVGEYTGASRIVVVEASGQTIGMIVDTVSETLKLPQDSVEPPSPIITSVDSEYIRGVGKLENRLIILLDIDKVLTNNEADKLRAVERMASQSAAKAA
jgi:purine-binding chemotaxis protein CheW